MQEKQKELLELAALVIDLNGDKLKIEESLNQCIYKLAKEGYFVGIKPNGEVYIAPINYQMSFGAITKKDMEELEKHQIIVPLTDEQKQKALDFNKSLKSK